MRVREGGMGRWRTILAAVAVVGLMVAIALPFGFAQPGDDIEQNIREANTPADHQALAAWYTKEAPAAQQLASKHFTMRAVYARITKGDLQ
jgi:hypothetical protein